MKSVVGISAFILIGHVSLLATASTAVRPRAADVVRPGEATIPARPSTQGAARFDNMRSGSRTAVVEGRVLSVNGYSGVEGEIQIEGRFSSISEGCKAQAGSTFRGTAAVNMSQVHGVMRCGSAIITLDVSESSLCEDTGFWAPPRVISFVCR